MKIVYILTACRGGIPHYTAELANSVANHADVTVIKSKETIGDDVFSNKIEIIDAFKPTVLSYVEIYKGTAFSIKNIEGFLSFRNIRVVEQINPDIIHFPGGLLPAVQVFTPCKNWIENTIRS